MSHITIWSSRKVNIGDYEGRDFGISFTRDQINNVDKTATITETSSFNIPLDADFKDTVKDMFKKIDSILDEKEDVIRLNTHDNVDFSSLDKLHNKGNAPKKVKNTRTLSNNLFDSEDLPEDVEEKPRRRRKRI